MSKYLLRRVLIMIPVLAGISLVLFTVLALAPGDPFEELATNPNVPPEVRANLRHQFGLDDPIPIRYARWFTSMLKGDWGFSFVSRINVGTLILQRLPTSLFVLGACATGAARLASNQRGRTEGVAGLSRLRRITGTPGVHRRVRSRRVVCCRSPEDVGREAGGR